MTVFIKRTPVPTERVREALADGSFTQLRRSAGVTLNLAARLADVGTGNLSRYERGLSTPSRPTLRRLGDVMRELERMVRAQREAAS